MSDRHGPINVNVNVNVSQANTQVNQRLQQRWGEGADIAFTKMDVDNDCSAASKYGGPESPSADTSSQ